MKHALAFVVCLTALTAPLTADDLFLGRQYETDAWAYSLAVCDLNRDGWQDVVLPDLQNDQLSILIGNGDGLTDLVTHYRTRESGIECGELSLTLTGELHDGYVFESTDVIETVGCGTRSQGSLARRPDSDRAREDGTRPTTTPERR